MSCALIESLGGEAFRIKLTDGKVQTPEPAEPAKKSVKSDPEPIENNVEADVDLEPAVNEETIEADPVEPESEPIIEAETEQEPTTAAEPEGVTEFSWLTSLTLKKKKREALRGKMDQWVKCFLPKLERESTRTAKCRLIASVERHEFREFLETSAADWRFFKFVGKTGIIFNENNRKLEDFKATAIFSEILGVPR